MTVREYIQSRFQTFGITLSEADYFDMCSAINYSIITPANVQDVKRQIFKFIPVLLASPATISEGGMSVSWDKDGLMKYYEALGQELGTKTVVGKPKVEFIHL